MGLVHLTDHDILDVFHKGHWILLSVGEKSDSIKCGEFNQIRTRKAVVDEIKHSKRGNRIGVKVSYMDEKNDITNACDSNHILDAGGIVKGD